MTTERRNHLELEILETKELRHTTSLDTCRKIEGSTRPKTSQSDLVPVEYMTGYRTPLMYIAIDSKKRLKLSQRPLNDVFRPGTGGYRQRSRDVMKDEPGLKVYELTPFFAKSLFRSPLHLEWNIQNEESSQCRGHNEREVIVRQQNMYNGFRIQNTQSN